MSRPKGVAPTRHADQEGLVMNAVRASGIPLGPKLDAEAALEKIIARSKCWDAVVETVCVKQQELLSQARIDNPSVDEWTDRDERMVIIGMNAVKDELRKVAGFSK